MIITPTNRSAVVLFILKLLNTMVKGVAIPQRLMTGSVDETVNKLASALANSFKEGFLS